MSEEAIGLTRGTLVMCQIGENTVVGPCRIVYVGADYVTVEDPDQKVWQASLDRVERADDQLSALFSTQV